MFRFQLITLLLVTAVIAWGEPLQVAVSVPPQAWLVRSIAGPQVEVTVIVPPGNSPATWNLTPDQYFKLRQIQLYFRVAHPAFLLESRTVDPVLLQRPRLQIVDLYQAADSLDFIVPGEQSDLDPHVWLSPAVIRNSLPALTAALSSLLPGQADYFRENQGHLEAELDSLDQTIHNSLDPLENRTFLVQHPAWGWFAAQYNLTQVALEHQGKESAPAELIRLIELGRRLELRAVFVQHGFSQRSALMLARELGITVQELDPLEEDWLTNMYHTAAVLRQVLEQEYE